MCFMQKTSKLGEKYSKEDEDFHEITLYKFYDFVSS